MISKAEVLQKLKKMGMTVADDESIVTVLLPTEVAFETGLKDVKARLKELGYESSFCVKQSRDAVMQQAVAAPEVVQEEADEEFVLDEDDDGQFSLGLEF